MDNRVTKAYFHIKKMCNDYPDNTCIWFYEEHLDIFINFIVEKCKYNKGFVSRIHSARQENSMLREVIITMLELYEGNVPEEGVNLNKRVVEAFRRLSGV